LERYRLGRAIWRAALSDAEWISLNAIERDVDYFQQVFVQTGTDLRSK